jgi:hypothetical protein
MPSVHTVLGASKAHVWVNCPGMPRIARKAPEQERTKYMEAGVDNHAWLEKLMKAGDPKHLVVNGGALNADALEANVRAVLQLMPSHLYGDAKVYLDSVRAALLKLGRDHGMQAIPDVWDVEVRLEDPTIHAEYGTTIDLVVGWSWGPLLIVDYKSGWKRVKAKQNDQLRMGVQLACTRYNGIAARVGIYQPMDDIPWSWDDFTDADIAGLTDYFRAAAKATDDPDAPTLIGDHCMDCPAAPACPHRLAEAGLVELVSRDELEQGEKIAGYLPMVARVRKLCDAIEAAAEAAVKKNALPGYKLVTGREGNRAWKDEALVRKAGFVGLPETESVAVVEKRLGKNAFNTLWAANVKRAPGKPTLAPESDPRPAYVMGLSAFDGDPEVAAAVAPVTLAPTEDDWL